MKGAKPKMDNVVPMKGDAVLHIPEAPEFMSEEGRAAWERVAPELVRKARLAPEWTDMFAAYCEACGDFIRYTGEIAAFGSWYEVETRNGLQQKKRATTGLRQDAIANMTRIGALFGLSPVDEQRMKTVGQGDLFRELMDQINGRS